MSIATIILISSFSLIAIFCLGVIQAKRYPEDEESSDQSIEKQLFSSTSLRISKPQEFMNIANVWRISEEDMEKGHKLKRRAEFSKKPSLVDIPIFRFGKNLSWNTIENLALAVFLLNLILLLASIIILSSFGEILPVLIFPAVTATFSVFIATGAYGNTLRSALNALGAQGNEEDKGFNVSGSKIYKEEHVRKFNIDVYEELVELVFVEKNTAVISILEALLDLSALDCNEDTKKELEEKLLDRLSKHLSDYYKKKGRENSVKKENNDFIAHTIVDSVLEIDSYFD